MKALMMIAFAGAMLASVSVAGTNDQCAEERLKAKTGRYSPAEESRRAKLASGAKHAGGVPERVLPPGTIHGWAEGHRGIPCSELRSEGRNCSLSLQGRSC